MPSRGFSFSNAQIRNALRCENFSGILSRHQPANASISAIDALLPKPDRADSMLFHPRLPPNGVQSHGFCSHVFRRRVSSPVVRQDNRTPIRSTCMTAYQDAERTQSSLSGDSASRDRWPPTGRVFTPEGTRPGQKTHRTLTDQSQQAPARLTRAEILHGTAVTFGDVLAGTTTTVDGPTGSR
jgi:hypothetical protein